MAKEMTDDEVMDYVFQKLFGDIDGIHARSMFPDEDGTEALGEKPESALNDQDRIPDAMKSYDKSDGGIDQDQDPLMEGAREGSRSPQNGDKDRGRSVDEMMNDTDDSEEEGGGRKKRLKGIGRFSPLMAQLHGDE